MEVVKDVLLQLVGIKENISYMINFSTILVLVGMS
jgi:hypothetical protein